MMNKTKVIVIILILTLFLSLCGFYFINGKVAVSEKKLITTRQLAIEEEFNCYDYTIDNPRIILNPYHNSPLTALIMFTTSKNVSPKITIVGKDELTSYTYEFSESRVHYLPIYGLYPDYENKIIITIEKQDYEFSISTSKVAEVSTIANENLGTKLSFNVEDNYSYAYDKNGDIRWILSKGYKGNITMLDNGHIIISGNRLDSNNLALSVIEMDLLGKIYNEYHIPGGYNYHNYLNADNNLIVKSISNIIEIDKQNGEILSSKKKKWTYQEINEYNIYQKVSYKIGSANIFGNLEPTKTIDKKIMIFNYHDLPEKYHVKFLQEEDRLLVENNFSSDDQVYLVLDKFLDKKIYLVDKKNYYINKTGNHGKYTIYLQINKNLYKTDYYVRF